MTDIQQTPSKVKLTAEEKKEKNREYMRVYMLKRRQNDPEFAKKQQNKSREIQYRRYNDTEDPSFKQKKSEYNILYYAKMKDAYKEVRKAIKSNQ